MLLLFMFTTGEYGNGLKVWHTDCFVILKVVERQGITVMTNE